MQMNETAFGFAMGVGYAAMMAAYAWFLGLFPRGRAAAKLLEEFYPGFRPTFLGGLVGSVYGFLFGFPFGYLIARAYNACAACQQARAQRPTEQMSGPQQ